MPQKVVVTSLLGDTGPHFELLQQAGFDRVRQRATALPLQAGLLVARAA